MKRVLQILAIGLLLSVTFAGLTAGVTNPDTTVTLRPETSTTTPGDQVTFEIVLTSASTGVGAFENLTIAVSDPGVAEIDSISSDVSSRVDSGVSANGNEAFVNVPFGGDTADSGSVTLAQVSVSAREAGQVSVDLAVTGDISNEDGLLYDVTSVEDATLTVEQSEGDASLARFDSDGNGFIDFDEVLDAIAAFNDETDIGGQPVSFEDVLDVIAAFNDETPVD